MFELTLQFVIQELGHPVFGLRLFPHQRVQGMVLCLTKAWSATVLRCQALM
jgi:hypothetical protein